MQPAAGYPVHPHPYGAYGGPQVPRVPQPWLRASDADRDRVVAVLRDAYADGRLDEAEFDARTDQVLAARTYADLQAPLADLVPAPQPSPQAVPRPVHRMPPATAGERVSAVLVHLAGYLALFVVPLIVALCARRPSHLHMHASDAANFQLTAVLATVVAAITGVGMVLVPFIWLGWAGLTLAGAVVASGGGRFRYPLTIRFFQ